MSESDICSRIEFCLIRSDLSSTSSLRFCCSVYTDVSLDQHYIRPIRYGNVCLPVFEHQPHLGIIKNLRILGIDFTNIVEPNSRKHNRQTESNGQRLLSVCNSLFLILLAVWPVALEYIRTKGYRNCIILRHISGHILDAR